MRKLISKRLNGWSGCEKLSIESYAETGIVSGSLLGAIEELIKECNNNFDNIKTPQDILNEVAAENMISVQSMVNTNNLVIIAMEKYAKQYLKSL